MLLPKTTVSSKQKGFTIVELLIVIVVIGILAAITIIAFSGVQSRANISVLQSDLQNTAKKLQADNVTLSSYPDTLEASNGGQGISVSNGTTLAYTRFDSGFCLSGYRGSATYRITHTTAPTAGSCSITNLVDNPSVESNTTSWSSHSAISSVRELVGGEWVYKSTRTSTGATAVYINNANPIAVTSGTSYTGSAYVTTSVSTEIIVRFRVGSSTVNTGNATTVTVPANTPTRISVTSTVTSPTVHLIVYSTSGAVGDVITTDKAMVTQGSSLYTYADGTSPNWTWIGTPNNSVSTGPATL